MKRSLANLALYGKCIRSCESRRTKRRRLERERAAKLQPWRFRRAP